MGRYREIYEIDREIYLLCRDVEDRSLVPLPRPCLFLAPSLRGCLFRRPRDLFFFALGRRWAALMLRVLVPVTWCLALAAPTPDESAYGTGKHGHDLKSERNKLTHNNIKIIQNEIGNETRPHNAVIGGCRGNQSCTTCSHEVVARGVRWCDEDCIRRL